MGPIRTYDDGWVVPPEVPRVVKALEAAALLQDPDLVTIDLQMPVGSSSERF
jgi:CheY-like chemotaxis protein